MRKWREAGGDEFYTVNVKFSVIAEIVGSHEKVSSRTLKNMYKK